MSLSRPEPIPGPYPWLEHTTMTSYHLQWRYSLLWSLAFFRNFCLHSRNVYSELIVDSVCYFINSRSTCSSPGLWLHSLPETLVDVRAMAEAVSRRPLTAETRFRSVISLCGICGGQSDTETGFSPSTSDFPCQFHSTVAPLHGNTKRN